MFHEWKVYIGNTPNAPALPLLFHFTSVASWGVPGDQITKEGKSEPNLKIFPHRNLAQTIRRLLECYIPQDWLRRAEGKGTPHEGKDFVGCFWVLVFN